MPSHEALVFQGLHYVTLGGPHVGHHAVLGSGGEGTRHLLNKDRLFNKCRPNLLVVNDSRGEVVDEMALAEAIKEKSIDYGGRGNEAEGRFLSGDCAVIQTSSGFYGNVKANAKFAFGMTELPYYPDVQGAPQNSIIGGASLWVMGGKKPEEYKGVAKFFSFLSQTPLQRDLHEVTGYLPITKAAYEATKQSGFYEKNPGREIPVLELTNKEPTENSRGLRFGNLVQIRDAWAEELEGAFAGKQSAQAAIDNAVKRGNQILRQFEAAAK
jgi:sn-glycerol 3-phosphate transport system substrate-binding protein